LQLRPAHTARLHQDTERVMKLDCVTAHEDLDLQCPMLVCLSDFLSALSDAFMCLR